MNDDTNDEVVELKKVVNSLVHELQHVRLKQAQLESAQKILRTESLRIKTMSEKHLPTIASIVGIVGRMENQTKDKS